MNPQGIIDKLNSCVIALSKGNDQLKTLALNKAKSERDYRVALSQKILELKAEGYAVSLMHDLSRGNEKVAELRLQRDIAESAYYTALNSMDNLKNEISILRSQLTWLRAELNNQ